MRWGGGRRRGSASRGSPLPHSPVAAGGRAGGEGGWGMKPGLCDGVGSRARRVLIIHHLQRGNLGHNDLPALCLSFSI